MASRLQLKQILLTRLAQQQAGRSRRRAHVLTCHLSGALADSHSTRGFHGPAGDLYFMSLNCEKTGEKEICLGSVELWRCMKGLEFGVIIWYHLQLCPYHIASQARSPLQGIEPRPHRNGIEKMCETFCFSYARSMVPWPIWNDGFSFNPPSHRSLRLALRLQWTQHFCFAVVSPGHKYHVALVQVDNPKQS